MKYLSFSEIMYLDKNSIGMSVMTIFWKNLRNIPARLIKKAMFVAGTITASAFILAVIGVVTMLVVDGRSVPPPIILPDQEPTAEYDNYEPYVENDDNGPSTVENDDDDSGFLRPPARTNFLLVGLDENNLADAIMVGCFYRDMGDIKLMAIPRDMYTRLPSHRLEQMRAEGLRPPTTMKVNAVRTHGGRNGMHYLRDQLGEMLGVEFQYYIEVRLDAFRRIVDAIGGVYFDVPVPMHYNPPDQALVINLQPGLQRLNGAQAEGLVRFRHFPTGDLARNESQIEFMRALITQVLTRDAIMNEPMTMINIVLNDVNSNIGLDVVRYVRYISSMSGDRITTFVMPGRGAYLGGISWFLPDAQRVPDVVNQIFYAEIQRDNEE